MVLVSNSRFYSLFRNSGILLAGLVLSGQTSAQEPRRVSFPYKNVSDLRGFLNVLTIFQRACLQQPPAPDLPASLVPEGYQVVTRDFHYWGKEGSAFPNTAILSKTGREDSDFAGGHPVIELMMPTDKLPHGECTIVWKRAWDYSDKVRKLIFNMAALLDARVSYYLGAVRDSQPENVFLVTDTYGFVDDWSAPCWDGQTCAFKVFGSFELKGGIDVTISRRAVLTQATDGQE